MSSIILGALLILGFQLSNRLPILSLAVSISTRAALIDSGMGVISDL